MLSNIKKALKEDLWEIIDENEIDERDINQFMFFIFYMLLEREKFSMKEVYEVSQSLKNQYYNVLNESKEMAIIGEPIKALKNIDEKFIEKIKPIIEKLYNNGTS